MTDQPTAGVALRPKVLAFAMLMEAKLRENDWKGGWRRDSSTALLKRLREETDELAEAARKSGEHQLHINPSPAIHWPSLVGSEAADVANFAMMVADVCGALPDWMCADLTRTPASGAVEANEAAAKAFREEDRSDPDHAPDGTVEGLRQAMVMLDTWIPDALPANEVGQVHFARAMAESAADTIRAYLAALTSSPKAEGDRRSTWAREQDEQMTTPQPLQGGEVTREIERIVEQLILEVGLACPSPETMDDRVSLGLALAKMRDPAVSSILALISPAHREGED